MRAFVKTFTGVVLTIVAVLALMVCTCNGLITAWKWHLAEEDYERYLRSKKVTITSEDMVPDWEKDLKGKALEQASYDSKDILYQNKIKYGRLTGSRVNVAGSPSDVLYIDVVYEVSDLTHQEGAEDKAELIFSYEYTEEGGLQYRYFLIRD